jgi:hypothetical protein
MGRGSTPIDCFVHGTPVWENMGQIRRMATDFGTIPHLSGSNGAVRPVHGPDVVLRLLEAENGTSARNACEVRSGPSA